MRLLCAWCGTELDQSPDSRAGFGQQVSHGICPRCASWLESESAAYSLERYLNGLDKPILVLDENTDVLFANVQALGVLGKDLPEVRGFKGGDVFECANAQLPGGCGNTIHCKGCAIRRTVEATFDSGAPADQVPATLNRTNGEGGTEVRFGISTTMVGEVVLLRIDEVDSETLE